MEEINNFIEDKENKNIEERNGEYKIKVLYYLIDIENIINN